MHAPHFEQTLAKLKQLPPEHVAEVEDFIDFLSERARRVQSGTRASLDFPVISVGQWPADFPTRREDLYGDDGR